MMVYETGGGGNGLYAFPSSGSASGGMSFYTDIVTEHSISPTGKEELMHIFDDHLPNKVILTTFAKKKNWILYHPCSKIRAHFSAWLLSA